MPKPKYDDEFLKPSNEQIQKAKELLGKFGKTRGKETLYTKISKKESTSEISVDQWKAKHKLGNKVGFSNTAINNRINGLKTLIQGEQMSTCRTEAASNFESFDAFLEKCQDTYDEATKYLNHTPSAEKKFNPETTHKQSKSYELAGTMWYVYFIHYINERNPNKKVNESSLGRGVTIFKENGEVEFTNVPTDPVHKYKGTYDSHMDMNNGYISINLEPDKIAEKGRQIHLKLFCRNKNQEIMVGQYMSFENGFILSGNTVYKNITKAYIKKPEDYLSKSFSFIHNHEEYRYEEIPLVYRLFLAKRNINFNLLNIDLLDRKTEDDLLNHILNYRDRDEKKFDRFLERIRPRVFLSIPNSPKSTHYINKFKSELDNTFQKKIHVSYKEGGLSTDYDLNGIVQPFMDIEKLKTTRFFVLILDSKPETLSYSHLQLGIAITVCKIAIVIYKKGDLSDSLKKMRSEVIKKIDYRESIDSEWAIIYEKLLKVLKDNLPIHLNGNIKPQ